MAQNKQNKHHKQDDMFNTALFSDIINIENDDADPSISDIEHNKTPTKKQHRYRDRKKSKSTTNVLLEHVINKKEDIYIRHRRHSESSSESHSNEYRKNKKNNYKKNKKKLPILIPLNVNGKTAKHNNNNNNNNNNNKKISKTPTPKSLTRSILSRYKSVKLKRQQSHDECKSNNSLGISVPLNVQHVIHVEWDDQRKAYKGIPDVWHSKIPQSYTVPTKELPVNFRENRSISLTQAVLNRAKVKTTSTQNIMNHQPISPTNINNIDLCDAAHASGNHIDIMNHVHQPLPGPRVFISSLNNRKQYFNQMMDNNVAPSFDGLCGDEMMTISQYLDRIGIADLNSKQTVSCIRREFFMKMGFSKRDIFISTVPRHIQQQILTYLDIKSYLRCCVTCSDLASFLDDPIIWKIQVLYKSKVQGTLYRENFYRLRHRIWKTTYLSMIKIDSNPSYYDYVWNIIVCGDTKSGQNRLVVSLGKHWRCKLTGLEPVISAVNGTYRFGVDFVIRRVIIRGNIIIKLQVWDGGNVMTDTSLLKSVNIFLILFDLTNKNSFGRIQNIARSMMSLLPIAGNYNVDSGVKLIMVGNTTNNANNRVISYEAAKRFANERGLMYLEANTDNNIQSINNAFVNLAEECIKVENEKDTLKSTKNNSNCSIQ